MDSPNRYSRTAVALHWLIFVGLIGQIAFGWFLDDVPRNTPDRAFYVNLHKSTGITLAVLILFRLYWRLGHPPPAFPAIMPWWERVLAGWSHVLLYVCMIVMPLSGYLASNYSKYGINFYNTWKLPPWGHEDRLIYSVFNGTHVVTSYVLVSLIAVHVLAAIRHLAKRDSVFARIWPGRPTD